MNNSLDPKFTTNRHWFEVWTTENDGKLLSCVNFYDMAWKDAANLAVQCYSQESSRNSDAYYTIVHAKFDGSNGMVREVIALPYDESSKVVNKLIKYRETLQ